jgi:hypothetical protein
MAAEYSATVERQGVVGTTRSDLNGGDHDE